MKIRTTALAAALVALTLPALAQTAATPHTPATTPGNASGVNGAPAPANSMATGVAPTPPMPMGPRARTTDYKNDKDRLEKMLMTGQNRADYRTMLEKEGWKISSINADKPDYLEYEIVKGDKSYEVQLDFDKNSPKATKVDVATNMWRAASTKAMLKDEKYVHSGPMTADPEGRYSDRRYMKDWTSEKDALHKALEGPNMKPADYRAKLEQMGYKVTSVNDREKDYVEYEVVKGNNSYEVQVDLDPKTMMGKKVDIDTNVWETDATERAKGEKK